MGNKISKPFTQQPALLAVGGVTAVSLLTLAYNMMRESVPNQKAVETGADNDDVPEEEVEEESDEEEEDDEALPEVDTENWVPFKDERVGISWMVPKDKWKNPEKKLTLLKNGCDVITYSFRSRPTQGQDPKATHMATVRVVRPISGEGPKAEAMKRIDLFKRVLANTQSPDELEIEHQRTFTLSNGQKAYEVECVAGEYTQYVCAIAYDNATIFFEEARSTSFPRISKGMAATHIYTKPSEAVFQWISENGFEFTLPSGYILKKPDTSNGLLAHAYSETIYFERNESGGMKLLKHKGTTLSSIHDDLKCNPDVQGFKNRGPISTSSGLSGEVVSFSQNDQQYLVFTFVHENQAYSFQFYTSDSYFNHDYRKQTLHCFETLGANTDSFRKAVNSVYSCIMNIPYEHRIKELYGDYFQSISNLDCSIITTMTMKKLPQAMRTVSHAIQSSLFEMMRAKRMVRLRDGRTAQIPVYKLVSQGVRDHQVGKVGQIIVQTNENAPKILLISLIPRKMDGELFWIEVRTQADPANWSEQYCADLHGSFHFSPNDETEEPQKPIKVNPEEKTEETKEEKKVEEAKEEQTEAKEEVEAPVEEEKAEEAEEQPEENTEETPKEEVEAPVEEKTEEPAVEEEKADETPKEEVEAAPVEEQQTPVETTIDEDEPTQEE